MFCLPFLFGRLRARVAPEFTPLAVAAPESRPSYLNVSVIYDDDGSLPSLSDRADTVSSCSYCDFDSDSESN